MKTDKSKSKSQKPLDNHSRYLIITQENFHKYTYLGSDNKNMMIMMLSNRINNMEIKSAVDVQPNVQKEENTELKYAKSFNFSNIFHTLNEDDCFYVISSKLRAINYSE